jgi:hypothetical protein
MKLVSKVRKRTLQSGERTFEDHVTKREASSSYRGHGEIKEKTKDAW